MVFFFGNYNINISCQYTTNNYTNKLVGTKRWIRFDILNQIFKKYRIQNNFKITIQNFKLFLICNVCT